MITAVIANNRQRTVRDLLKGLLQMLHVARPARQVCCLLTAVLAVSRLTCLGATPCCPGDDWLSASEEVRKAYVGGLIQGLTSGFGQGCLTGTKDLKASAPGVDADPSHQCLQKNYEFLKSTEQYITLITQLYQQYPSDRDMRVLDVLLKLSRGLSPDQIHAERKGRNRGDGHETG